MLAAGESLFTGPGHSDSARPSTYDDHHSQSTCHKTSASMETLQLPSPAIPPTLSHSHRSRSPSGLSEANATSIGGARRHRGSPPKERGSSTSSSGTTYSARSRRRIAITVVKGAWRRYGMISANAALFAAWLATYRKCSSSNVPVQVCTRLRNTGRQCSYVAVLATRTDSVRQIVQIRAVQPCYLRHR